MISVAHEVLEDSLVTELGPVIVNNWRESGGYADLELDMNWEMYQELEILGVLNVFVARTGENVVAGYLFYIVSPGHPHDRKVPFAMQDAIYVERWARKGGAGIRLLEFAEEHLKALGVGVLTQSAKPGSSFNKVLECKGYEHTENMYLKRI